MSQAEKAKQFAALHRKQAPLVLYNIWDAGGAQAVVAGGATAVATGSWSVAGAQGYPDGEALPLDLLLTVVARICASVEVPVSVDFEGAYAAAPDAAAENVRRVVDAGAIGINFEDRVVQGAGLYDIDAHAARIRAIRQMANAAAVPLFINARTDLFLQSKPEAHAGHIAEALERAAAYAEAGASGIFVPGLTDPALVAQVTEAVALPVNVLVREPHAIAALAAQGVARVSFGPAPYRQYVADMTRAQAALLA
ncbi:MAG: isocitrate lyase/phosphoenolpyruvate mutase family protein [Pseudomonadota bacterium]